MDNTNQNSEIRERAKSKIIRVTLPDGETVCYNRATTTFVECLKRIGIDRLKTSKLQENRYPLLSETEQKDYKPLQDGWYVNTSGNKYRLLLLLNDELQLGWKIESGTDFETTKSTVDLSKRADKSTLLVKMPDGTYIGEQNPIDTFTQVLWGIGIDALYKKDLVLSGKSLITYKQEYKNQVQVGKDRWATVPPTSKEKQKWLKVIALMMRTKLEVTLI